MKTQLLSLVMAFVTLQCINFPRLACSAQSVGLVLFQVDASPKVGTPLAYDPTQVFKLL